MSDQPQDWIAVASAEHVRRGRREGFMQVCHGKATPLRRVKPGSRVVYYSPTETFGGGDRLQAFTAFGVVRDIDAYQSTWVAASIRSGATSTGSRRGPRRSSRCWIGST
jgi:hypothetical protein